MTREELTKTKEWFDHKFRGSTVYEGHPIEVIGKLIENALVKPEEPIADDAVAEAVEYFKNWPSTVTYGNATHIGTAINVLRSYRDQQITQGKKEEALEALNHLEVCMDGCYAQHEINIIRRALQNNSEVK